MTPEFPEISRMDQAIKSTRQHFPRRGLMLALGIVGVIGFTVHAGWHIATGTPEDVIWICHLSALAVGLGLIFQRPLWSAVGLLCLLVGLPMWILYLLGGEPFILTSPLTHVLGPAIGLFAVREMGMPRRSWLWAWGWVIAITALTLAVTPDASNVNLALGPSTSWPWAPTYWPYHISWMMGFWGLVLFMIEAGLRRTGIKDMPRGSRGD